MTKFFPMRSLLIVFILHMMACQNETILPEVGQWNTLELMLESNKVYENPYVDVSLYAEFISGSDTLLRPGFYDGDQHWKIRFSPPDTGNIWSWNTICDDQANLQLHGQSGRIRSTQYQGSNNLLARGLLKMSSGKRNVVHHDGTPFLVVGDTPWALPFRATREQVEWYAQDRQAKGFNTALLMSVQPDMEAEGPAARNTEGGFMRGFKDLSAGHLNQLNSSYFQYLDTLIDILIDHEIVPVFQPVFHGYGWKGKNVLGNYVDPGEYVRYCKYLLARYGSKPAFWLLAGDNGGDDPGVKESGEMMELWDCYQQPTGLHYNPCDDYVASWAVDNPIKHCMHYNKSHQAAPWLDFQWAQTGHGGEHLYHKVERMYENEPIKACANGEPTYEGMNNGSNGLGWWQGKEAWMQLMSGGTMGVVYGAACVWQWKVSADEEGWPAWTDQPLSWKEALNLEGSQYVGHVAKAFAGFDFSDMEKRSDLTTRGQPLLAKEPNFYISYLNQGGEIEIPSLPKGQTYRWFDPKTGRFEADQIIDQTPLIAPDEKPWVLIVGKR